MESRTNYRGAQKEEKDKSIVCFVSLFMIEPSRRKRVSWDTSRQYTPKVERRSPYQTYCLDFLFSLWQGPALRELAP